jgi:tetratricopeptide (TPR) repeat protein
MQTVLLEALRAYELARATRLRAEGEARAARRAREEALQAEETRARQALEAERHAEESVLRAEQERLGRLQAAADAVESAARALLEKAGLAYIAGAPAPTASKPAAQLRADAAQAFAEAQTAYADLRLALVTLAQAHLEAGRWEEARRVLQPLLEDTRAPLYAEARDLLAESHYRPALAALEAGQWEAARQGFAEVLKINPAYRTDDVEVCKLLDEVRRFLSLIKYQVILKSAGQRLIEVIKVVRALTGSSLAEAMTLCKTVPSTVLVNATMQEAERAKAALEAVGAEVEIVEIE